MIEQIVRRAGCGDGRQMCIDIFARSLNQVRRVLCPWRRNDMTNALRVLMLLTDGFGGVGGIAKFNRDFLQALDGCAVVERVHAQPRLIPEPIEEVIPEAVVYDRRAAGGKLAFMRRLGAHAWGGGRVDLVICGHLYLLPAAWLLARLRGARLALIIHGIEAWAPSRKVLGEPAGTPRGYLHFRQPLFGGAIHALVQGTLWIGPSSCQTAWISTNFNLEDRDSTLIERYGLQSSKVIMTMGRLASQERYKGFDEVIEIMPELLKRFPTAQISDRRRWARSSAARSESWSLGAVKQDNFHWIHSRVRKGRTLQFGRRLCDAKHG